eukprot:CAMPEP_0179119858 /NCGR_PEP_ID=MMETSP0796-20121207/56446_1 /TAXON_ID=73915 /ORGANISM="Pyrodinium bahamense, Strain pbaha01" /LENGTH=30 /DNA_ID= /DNA_START= /DNA_END= /DNA_ORIENTATION=
MNHRADNDQTNALLRGAELCCPGVLSAWQQ